MKRVAVALAMLALAGTAEAGTREDVLSRIARCGAITDDHTWLNCLYGAAQPMRSQLGLPPAPSTQTSLVPAASAASPRFSAPVPAANAPQESGGFFSRLLGGEKVLTDIKLTDYYFNPQGFFVVTLANGQIWEQQDGPSVHWRGPASQYMISISKGAVGSFNLTVADEGVLYKVHRIR
jgi:hypothetical protein